MVTLTALWLPTLVSAVIVFVASSVIHMVLGYHRSDWKRLPNEDALLAALRPFKLAPGDYFGPVPRSRAEMSTPEFKEKLEQGPQIGLSIMPTVPMVRRLALWFVYLLVVSVFAAYVASLVLGADAPYLRVFRIASTVAFAGYTLALWQGWVWYSRSLYYTLTSTFDGLVYALLTGGVFGWLWP